MKLVPVLLIFSLLSACGGGSNSSKAPIPSQPSIVNSSIVAFNDNVDKYQAVELFLYFPNENIANIQWEQLSGESVQILTPNSKGIAFTPITSGNYSFEVSFTNANGLKQTLKHDLSVSEEHAKISARLGHVVSEGNKVSLRVNAESGLNTSTIEWRQTSGPTVVLSEANTTGKTAIFFNAPAVEKDTIVTFESSIFSGGEAFKDTVAVLIENKSAISQSALFDTRVADTFPYNADSLYKNSLVKCVYNNEITVQSICKLNELPLIAQDTITPTIEDIMDRVVVSHEWMGDRFKAFIENHDPHNDLKNMLRATTAIVISYDVRPSFYWAATGAIYLDADNFWLTPNERDTLNEAPDYRASFGNELQFTMPWRYVQNNDYLSRYISEETRTSRDEEHGLYGLISLMYHELAHANDFFPKSSWFSLDQNKQIIANIPESIQSDILSQTHPLYGDEMYGLAKVRYKGDSANTVQKEYTPEDVSLFFSAESSPQFYNYSSKREDYAMLFDGFMMKARYNIDRDIAVANQPGEEATGSDYIVTWGQRGRIGDVSIKPRVSFVVQRILPEFSDFQTVLNDLPEPLEMDSGKSWIDNLAISPTPQSKSLASAQVSALTKKVASSRPMNEFEHRYIEKALPKIE